MERLRSLPGVAEATPIRPFPLQGGGSSTQLKPLGAPDEAKVRAPVYRAGSRVLETLGLELVAGRTFTDDDLPEGSGPQILNIIVTQDLADALFPDGDALGQTVDTGSEEHPDVIVGIVRQMHTPYGGGPMEDRIFFYPSRPHSESFISYLVRAEPGQLDGLIPSVEETLTTIDDRRVVRVRPLMDYKARGYAMNHVMAWILGVIIFLLLFVASLGLFGVTAFSVTRRTREIGTRRALGATRIEVFRQFLLESATVAAAGTALGLVGAVGLNIALVSAMDAAQLDPALAIFGIGLLWAVGVVATLLPASKAMRIEPAIATRSV